MRLLLLGLLVSQASVMSAYSDAHDAKSSVKAHVWEEIDFAPPDKFPTPYFSLRPDDQGKGLVLNIEFTISKAEKDGFVSAQLDRESGETSKPLSGNLVNPDPTPRTVNPIAPGQPEPENTEWSARALFPWGKNELKSAWMEVSLGKEKYWLELPYGFDRDPKDPLPPAQPGGIPLLPTGLKTPTDHDHVLFWQGVVYDLGKIQNGWDLSFTQSNPGDGACEVCLVSQDSKKKVDLFSPRISMRALGSDGDAIGGNHRGIRFDDDGFRRDSFNLDRCPCDESERCWGQIELTVDKKNYRTVVPSSLYKYEHGHAQTN